MSFSHLSSNLLIIAFVAVGIFACSQALYVPSAEVVTDPHLLNELTQGRKLYIKNCGSCHNLFVPEQFADSHWIAEMDSMKVAAKISDTQAELILKYLTEDIQSN